MMSDIFGYDLNDMPEDWVENSRTPMSWMLGGLETRVTSTFWNRIRSLNDNTERIAS